MVWLSDRTARSSLPGPAAPETTAAPAAPSLPVAPEEPEQGSGGPRLPAGGGTVGGPPADHPNAKNELQGLLCRQLGRPISKGEMLFSAAQVGAAPPTFEATAEVLGKEYRGGPRPSKKAAEQAAALVALAALRPASGASEMQVDYKGQLLGWLQARGMPGASAARFEVERAEADDKAFVGTVTLPALGGRAFTGAPQSRDAHGASAKARRAAEQDVARVAMAALAGTDIGGAPADGGCGAAHVSETRRVRVVRLLPDASALPVVEELEVEDDGFLQAAARALGCRDMLLHPLHWQGPRPKGLCLYEAVPDAARPLSEPNCRASSLAHAPVAGDALLLDASAHTSGAELVDFAGARYEALRRERAGALRGSVGGLNASRGMSIGGHPELPREYDERRWAGTNPKTLLLETLQRCRAPGCAAELPRFEVAPSGALFLAAVTLCGVPGPDAGVIRVEGAPRGSKAEAQLDAALGALRTLADNFPGGPPGSTLAETALETLAAAADGGAPACPGACADDGLLLTLDYSIWLEPRGDASGEPLLLESQSRLRAAVGARVLHPALERLAASAAVGAGEVRRVDCEYEGVPCRLRLELEVAERAEPSPAAEAAGAPAASQVVVFDPPLAQQRRDFAVAALLEHGVRSAVDLGCGDGQLLEALLRAGLLHVVGVDHSERRAKAAIARAEAVRGDGQVAEVFTADLMEPDERWAGLEAAVLCEVLEHLTDARLTRLADAMLGASPRVALVTTPNGEFGAAQRGGRMRHADHEREWTRSEFRAWAAAAATRHGYMLAAPAGVGEAAGHFEEGPCTQIAVFVRAAGPVEVAPRVDVEAVAAAALRTEELEPGSGLPKYVVMEGEGDPPPPSSRISLHFATHLADGRQVDGSRRGRQAMPVAFQLGGCGAPPAWQRAVATMRRGEVAWVRSAPAFAYGMTGAPPLIPGGETLWFRLELEDFRPPGKLRTFKELRPALEEAERHLAVGRGDLERQAHGQARQAFRRALAAVPEKLLLGEPPEDIARFAAAERAALLNQALCSQRLGQAAEEGQGEAHWQDAARVCSLLLERHLAGAGGSEAARPSPATTAEVVEALRAASGGADCFPQWAAKA